MDARTWAVATVAAAVLPFLPALGVYFTGDDFGLVRLFSHKPPPHFLTLFTSSWTEDIYGRVLDELRPLVALSYQMDSVWGAANPGGSHASNLAYHVVNALLVLGLGRAVCGLRWASAGLAAVLFAVLPIHTPAVAWISGRADSIPAAFYVGAFLLWALWRKIGQTIAVLGRARPVRARALQQAVRHHLRARDRCIRCLRAALAPAPAVVVHCALPPLCCRYRAVPRAARGALREHGPRAVRLGMDALLALAISVGPLRRPDARLVVGQCGSVLVPFPSGSHAGKLDWLGSSSPWWRSLRWPS